MFKKIKNAAEYTVLAYTAIIAVKGLTGLASETIFHFKHRPSKK